MRFGRPIVAVTVAAAVNIVSTSILLRAGLLPERSCISFVWGVSVDAKLGQCC
jgi:hypothetical protein